MKNNFLRNSRGILLSKMWNLNIYFESSGGQPVIILILFESPQEFTGGSDCFRTWWPPGKGLLMSWIFFKKALKNYFSIENRFCLFRLTTENCLSIKFYHFISILFPKMINSKKVNFQRVAPWFLDPASVLVSIQQYLV